MSQAVDPGDPAQVDGQPEPRKLTGHDRQFLCISRPLDTTFNAILNSGDSGFIQQVSRFYSPLEADALDQLSQLKDQLRHVKGDGFWTAATEGLARMLGAQYAFISKRMFVDQINPSVTLPPLGEPDSCLLGMSIYYSGGVAAESFNAIRAKYLGYNCPCAYMKHDKTLLIPEGLTELIPNNPNPLPEEPQGYLAVPLTYTSKRTQSTVTFGHFGVMWTDLGLEQRKLSFSFLENLLHGVQDLISNQFVDQNLVDDSDVDLPSNMAPCVPAGNAFMKSQSVPEPVLATSSLKPFAKSLSHELRTPMQGVVGMLDVMFAQVQTASEGQVDPKLHSVFLDLKESIEIVQDSARRAVEAADNIVHAYDMDMSVPESVPILVSEDTGLNEMSQFDTASIPFPPTPVDPLSPARSNHKRQLSSSTALEDLPPTKLRRKDTAHDIIKRSPPFSSEYAGAPTSTVERVIAPGIRLTNIRSTLQEIINDVLIIGRPLAKIAQPIDGGEEIEVRRKSVGSNHELIQIVKWTVDPEVPDTVLIDERDFVGLIYRVLHNAVKFTEAGNINVSTRLSAKGKHWVISVEDTGPGIPMSFMPKLFKPFSKEDDSTTRQSEGLGLGLMVAKGLARKLHGDLLVARSNTHGARRGTEFQLRLPLIGGDHISRSNTPFGSPSPSGLERSSLDLKSQSPLREITPASSKSHSRNTSSVSKTEITSAAAVQPVPQATSIPAPGYIPRILRMDEIPLTADAKLSIRLPKSFLVVEDNIVLRKILVKMLTDFGYKHIIEAHDGAHAVRQAEKHKERFRRGEVLYDIDVVLMDLWMPRMNGYEAADKIRKLYGSSPPAILAITADVTDEATEKVAEYCMKGPLTKPYKMKDLERYLLESC